MTRHGAALKGVEGGSSEWLVTARRLYGFVDGGTADELFISLSVALTRAPEKVLVIVGQDETVCGNFEGARNRQEAVRHLDAQEKAVKTVQAPRLAAARRACLLEIRNARALVPKGP